jgi:predicted amidohydrolase YtcJ
MDDRTTGNNPGRIVEAVAIKKGQIIALGTSSSIGRLAGANSRIIDVKSRTVIPGIVETHSHLFSYASRWDRELGIRSPNPGISATAKADRTPEATQVIINKTSRENLPRVKPREWIAIRVDGNPELGVHDNQPRTWASEKVLTSRKNLDRVAPDNPVIVRAGTRSFLNSKALAAEKAMPGYGEFIKESMEDPGTTDLGLIGSPERGALDWEMFYQAYPLSKLAELLRRESEAWAAYGVTTFSTRIPHPTIMSAYNYLHRNNQLPIRLAAHYEVHRTPGPLDLILSFYRYTPDLSGLGSDLMWITGIASERWDSLFPEVWLGRKKGCTGSSR